LISPVEETSGFWRGRILDISRILDRGRFELSTLLDGVEVEQPLDRRLLATPLPVVEQG